MTTIEISHPRPRTGVSLRRIILPAEHGGWGIVLEPALVAVLAAPSFAGFAIAAAALLTFLARQPAKMVTGDVLIRRRLYPRTRTALLATFLTGIGVLAMLAVALDLVGPIPLVPLVLAAPLAAIQIVFDARNRSRGLLPEIAGAIAMGASAAMILLAGGWSAALALALWLLMSLRSATAIVYVRARLQRAHGKTASALPSLVLHLIALTVAAALAFAEIAPWLAVAAFAALTFRAVIGLSPRAHNISARTTGFTEIGWGAVTVLAIGLGFLLGL